MIQKIKGKKNIAKNKKSISNKALKEYPRLMQSEESFYATLGFLLNTYKLNKETYPEKNHDQIVKICLKQYDEFYNWLQESD